MKEIILGTLAIVTVIATIALCRTSSKADKKTEGLEHPERIKLKGE